MEEQTNSNTEICPPPAAKPPFWKNTLFQIAAFIAVILIVAAAVTGGLRGSDKPAGGHIAVVHISGVMLTGFASDSIFGFSDGSFSGTVAENIRKAADDPSVKGIILSINSPGGTPVAAEEISEAVDYAKAQHKPVYASMEDTAASAAYWVAAKCDKIYAYRTTITGSIGVIMHGYDASGLMKMLGVAPQTVKAGKYKDIGSMDRAMSEEEKAILQKMIDTTYEVFISEVAAGRRLGEARVRQLAEGRVYSGVQAKAAGLVDETGSYNSCLAAIGKAAGLGDSPEAVAADGKNNIYQSLFGSVGPDMEKRVLRNALDMLANEAGTTRR